MSLREAVRNLLVLEHPEYVPILGRTKTTKKLLDCEKMLGSYFQKLFKIIDKNDMSVLASQQQFGNELHDKVLDCIQQSYFAGQDYVAKATKSTIPILPTPARARYRATGEPNPPAPIIKTFESIKALCPLLPTLGIIRCLLYLST